MRPDTWLLERWNRLGPRTRIAAAASVVIVLAGGSLAGYRQYHYMMHDNEFCLSCHLMTNAYDRFQRSAHNQLSCHTCHPAGPSTVWQLYATVFLNPTRVNKHAHVPNKTCASCHVRGDPAKWKIIATTAGHRVHLESTLPVLRDIQCVTCHSYSVHEFSPNKQTCLQAQCHPDARIRLGIMSSRDIYCTTCHNFTAEAPTLTYDSLGEPLSPKAQQCYSCHEMREALNNMEFTHDPHRGECGMCHNPHTQVSKREAAATCTSSRCHATWRESSFHIGVPNPEQCTRCHVPHSWKVEGRNCLRCHQNIAHDRGRARAAAGAVAPSGGTP
jgi:nitrate/TMAO reductase-like tetraheme cytochrome c subunit